MQQPPETVREQVSPIVPGLNGWLHRDFSQQRPADTEGGGVAGKGCVDTVLDCCVACRRWSCLLPVQPTRLFQNRPAGDEMRQIQRVDDLRRILGRIDGRGYKAYKDIEGCYDCGSFSLHVDYVQGDPFASPSKVRVRVKQGESGLHLRC